jgi:hypothetical protein
MVVGTKVPVRVGRCQAKKEQPDMGCSFFVYFMSKMFESKNPLLKKQIIQGFLKEMLYRHTPKCAKQHKIN